MQNIDPEDWQFTAAPNLLLTLSIEGSNFEQDGGFYCCTSDGLDADLLIYNEDGSLASFGYTSSSTSTYKQIVLPVLVRTMLLLKLHKVIQNTFNTGSNVTDVSTLSLQRIIMHLEDLYHTFLWT